MGAFAALACVALLAGCGTGAIIVSEAAITDRPEARVVGWTADEDPKLVFSPEDEKVTVKVLFEFNYRAVYEWYRVEWIAPDGSPYQVVSLRTEFGSHRDLTASLPIRGKMASRLPGIWRARIWLQGRDGQPDRLLVARIFRIAQPSAEQLARGLTAVDIPPPSGPRPLAGTAPDASGGMPAAVPAQDAGAAVLPPLAIGASGSTSAAVAGTAPAAATVEPQPSEAGVVSVSVTSTPGPATASAVPPRRDAYPGCPPLYYPPGPGCVEQAPEE